MSTAEKRISADKIERISPRERILSAASELFYRHGIRAVGVDAVAEAAETNKMTLYRHFSSKDELVADTSNAWPKRPRRPGTGSRPTIRESRPHSFVPGLRHGRPRG